MVSPMAVGAAGCRGVSLLVLLETDACCVGSTANSTSLSRCAACLVVAKLVALEASKWFWLVESGFIRAPATQVNS